MTKFLRWLRVGDDNIDALIKANTAKPVPGMESPDARYAPVPAAVARHQADQVRAALKGGA